MINHVFKNISFRKCKMILLWSASEVNQFHGLLSTTKSTSFSTCTMEWQPLKCVLFLIFIIFRIPNKWQVPLAWWWPHKLSKVTNPKSQNTDPNQTWVWMSCSTHHSLQGKLHVSWLYSCKNMTKTGQVASCAVMFIKFITLLVLSGLQVFKRNHKADRKKEKHSHHWKHHIYNKESSVVMYKKMQSKGLNWSQKW